MHEDCVRWLTEVEASLPSAVFEVKSDTHAELTDVRIAIDDAEPISLVGRAVSFDPGRHRVRFEAAGYEPVTRELFFSEGQKLRREAVVLKALPTSKPAAPAGSLETANPPEAPSSGGLGLPFFVATSVAVVGGAGFAVFGLRARADDRALGRCEPNCTEAQVSDTRRNYLFANIGLGVGAAGLVTATILFFVTPSSPPASSKRGVQLGLCERAVGPSVLVGF